MNISDLWQTALGRLRCRIDGQFCFADLPSTIITDTFCFVYRFSSKEAHKFHRISAPILSKEAKTALFRPHTPSVREPRAADYVSSSVSLRLGQAVALTAPGRSLPTLRFCRNLCSPAFFRHRSSKKQRTSNTCRKNSPCFFCRNCV